MPSNLGPRSQRRQNASCDRCRHSKRRCLIAPTQEQEREPVCTNCERLSYSCTFNFAESQRASHKRKAHGSLPILRDQPSSLESTQSLEVSDDGYQVAQDQDLISLSSTDFDFDTFVDFGLGSLAVPEIPSPSSCPVIVEDQHQAHNIWTVQDSRRSPKLPKSHSIVGCSLNSPVHLLSSRWEAWLLSEQLARIYQTITSDSASIFLDYDCNLLTGSCRYRFAQSNADSSALVSSNSIPENAIQVDFASVPLPELPEACLNQTPDHLSMVDSRVPTQISQNRSSSGAITVLGAVRFLDHFGELYGNQPSVTAKAQSEQVLKEVLRCFAFQWLPNTMLSIHSDSSDFMLSSLSTAQEPQQSHLAFVDTWIRARSLIKNAQSTPSFGVVYATLLFDTIIVPVEAARTLANDVFEHVFLDNAFHKLSQLERQVKKYCTNLGTRSRHGALIESSLSIICWFAYLRDTVVGLMTNRPCRLEDVDSHNKGNLIYQSTSARC